MSAFAIVLLVVGLLGLIYFLNFHGWESFTAEKFRGKTPYEWRKIAGDLDVSTRMTGYDGMFHTGQIKALEEMFASERNDDAKMSIALNLMDIDDFRPKLIVFALHVLSDSYSIGSTETKMLIEGLARHHDAESLIPKLNELATKDATNRDARELLKTISDYSH